MGLLAQLVPSLFPPPPTPCVALLSEVLRDLKDHGTFGLEDVGCAKSLVAKCSSPSGWGTALLQEIAGQIEARFCRGLLVIKRLAPAPPH